MGVSVEEELMCKISVMGSGVGLYIMYLVPIISRREVSFFL